MFFYSCNVSEPQRPKFCVREVGVNLNVFLLTISTPYWLHCNTTLHQHRDCDQVPVPGRQTWPLSALLSQAQVKLSIKSFVMYPYQTSLYQNFSLQIAQPGPQEKRLVLLELGQFPLSLPPRTKCCLVCLCQVLLLSDRINVHFGWFLNYCLDLCSHEQKKMFGGLAEKLSYSV